MIEAMPLEKAPEAYAKMMSGKDICARIGASA
jgi:hypothetical protein